MPNYIGLYYPAIGFRDDSWVKLAALYWDKLGRIVPGGYHPQDSSTVQQLTAELDFIKNFEPSIGGDQAAVGEMFLSMLRKNLAKLEKLYRIESKSELSNAPVTVTWEAHDERWFQRIPENIAYMPEYEPIDIPNTRLAYLYEEKVFNPLGEALVDAGLAIKLNKGNAPTVIGMHPKLAFIYMEMLAEQMASRRQFHPVTDNVSDHVISSGYSIERLTQALLSNDQSQVRLVESTLTKDEIEIQRASIAIQSVLPRDIANVPITKIIQLRKKHRDELTAFQNYIHDFVADLEHFQAFDDPAALEAHLKEEYEKRFKPQLDDFKKSLKSLGIDTALGAMNVRAAIPALFASAGELLHLTSINPIIVGAGAIAFSVFPVIQSKQKAAKELVRSSPTAYLFYTQEGLEPVNLASQVVRRARQILFRI